MNLTLKNTGLLSSCCIPLGNEGNERKLRVGRSGLKDYDEILRPSSMREFLHKSGRSLDSLAVLLENIFVIKKTGGAVRIACKISQWSLEEIYGAAYMLTDRAFVSLKGNPKLSVTVVLEPKNPTNSKSLASLKKLFLEELRTQKLRWEIARNNQPIREHIVSEAVRLAQNPSAAQPATPELTETERLEIEKLIAEVEAEIKERNKTAPATDPLGIAATWEEKRLAAPTKN